MTGHQKNQAAKAAITEEASYSPPENQGLADARIVYHTLKRAVNSWQADNAGKLAAWLPAELSAPPLAGRALPPSGARRIPIFTLAELPDNLILELWERLNAQVGVQASAPALEAEFGLFKKSGTLADPGMLARLSLALSGVAGLARRQFSPQELEACAQGWENAVCPVCGEGTDLALLLPPSGKRRLSCRVCGHDWPVRRVGCVLCGSEDAQKQVYLHAEGYPGVEMAVCQACGKSFKEIDLRENPCEDYVWEDIRSLPLNYAVRQWLEAQLRPAGRPL